MRKFLLIILFLFPLSLSAQIIDDSAPDSLKEGATSFEQGVFVAYLADTVSPGFVRQLFSDMDITIQEMDIRPLAVLVTNWPSDNTLAALKAHPQIRKLEGILPKISIKALGDSLRALGWEEEQIVVARMEYLKGSPDGTYLLEFDYPVNVEKAEEILSVFWDVQYRVFRNDPRTVRIRTEIGEEQTVMAGVNQLPIVTSTALIGIVGNQ